MLTFDNSNAAGTQINASWAIDWQRPDATEPTITVTPNDINLIPGATYHRSPRTGRATAQILPQSMKMDS